MARFDGDLSPEEFWEVMTERGAVGASDERMRR